MTADPIGPVARPPNVRGAPTLDAWRIATPFALAAIILFPLSPLLTLRAHFGGDFDVNYWITGYIAAYLRLYHHPTNVIQTTTSLGIAFPVFYGVLFFRLAGVASALTDGDVGFRILIFGVITVQVLTVYRAARVLAAGRGIALLLSMSGAFSTYQLTNLYNRGDLSEFTAVTLLVTAVAAWFWSHGAASRVELWLSRSVLAASLTFMCGTHAITMALGGTTFFFIAGATLVFDHRRPVLLTLAIAAAAAFAGASIAIVDYALVAYRIHFYPGVYRYGFAMFPGRIDLPIARFSPIPLDPQTLYRGTLDVSTPYLEASIDYIPVLLSIAVLALRRNRVALVLAGAGAAVAVISVWPWFWTVAPASVHFMQFPYRLTSYVNVLLLGCALTLLWRLPVEVHRVAETPLPWVAATLAALACIIKLDHGATQFHTFPDRLMTLTAIGPFVPIQQNYITVPQGGPRVPPHADPPAVGMYALGAPIPQSYRADRHGLIFTRILVLPWNKIIVDGRELPEDRKLAWRDSLYYGFQESPHSRHEVQTTLRLPTIVDRAIRVAEYSFVLEFSAALVLSGVLAVRQRQTRQSLPFRNARV